MLYQGRTFENIISQALKDTKQFEIAFFPLGSEDKLSIVDNWKAPMIERHIFVAYSLETARNKFTRFYKVYRVKNFGENAFMVREVMAS